jgi:hypothetical protein
VEPGAFQKMKIPTPGKPNSLATVVENLLEINNQKILSVFPNPVGTNNLVLELNSTEYFFHRIHIYDLSGKLMFGTNLYYNVKDNKITLEREKISFLSHNAYLLKVIVKDKYDQLFEIKGRVIIFQ